VHSYYLVTLFTLSLFIIYHTNNNNCSSVSVTRLQVFTELQDSLNLSEVEGIDDASVIIRHLSVGITAETVITDRN
jgi:hypothetical protein